MQQVRVHWCQQRARRGAAAPAAGAASPLPSAQPKCVHATTSNWRCARVRRATRRGMRQLALLILLVSGIVYGNGADPASPAADHDGLSTLPPDALSFMRGAPSLNSTPSTQTRMISLLKHAAPPRRRDGWCPRINAGYLRDAPAARWGIESGHDRRCDTVSRRPGGCNRCPPLFDAAPPRLRCPHCSGRPLSALGGQIPYARALQPLQRCSHPPARTSGLTRVRVGQRSGRRRH